MAATLTLLSASPYALKYAFAHNGAGSGSVVKTQAEMITDLLTAGAGPLLRLFQDTTDDTAWGNLGLGSLVSVLSTIRILPIAVTAELNVTSPAGRGLQGIVGNADSANAVIEIRFRHSYDR